MINKWVYKQINKSSSCSQPDDRIRHGQIHPPSAVPSSEGRMWPCEWKWNAWARNWNTFTTPAFTRYRYHGSLCFRVSLDNLQKKKNRIPGVYNRDESLVFHSRDVLLCLRYPRGDSHRHVMFHICSPRAERDRKGELHLFPNTFFSNLHSIVSFTLLHYGYN